MGDEGHGAAGYDAGMDWITWSYLGGWNVDLPTQNQSQDWRHYVFIFDPMPAGVHIGRQVMPDREGDEAEKWMYGCTHAIAGVCEEMGWGEGVKDQLEIGFKSSRPPTDGMQVD